MTVRFTLGLLIFATTVTAAEVTRAGRWDLHSSFWMNLHQTLMRDASSDPRDMSRLTAEERAAWQAAVAVYREAAGSGNITFSEPMVAMQDELTQVANDAVNPAINGTIAEAMKRAAPVYRAHWWMHHDTANRFFIGYAAAMLRDSGEELVRAHEKVYGAEYPKVIRVDITGYAGRFGAYSHRLRDGGFVVTMSSRDSGYQGLAALEMILHESSHAVVTPRYGSVARAIASAAASAGIEIPRDLWHAILFATSGELTRRAYVNVGVAAYKPSSDDLFARVWPQYRQPIETHWYPYLSGTGTLGDAIEKIVAGLR